MGFPGLSKVVPPRVHIAFFLGLEIWAKAIVLENDLSGISLKETIHEECLGAWVESDYAAHGASEDLMKLLLDDSSNGGYSPEQPACSMRRAVLAQREGAVQILLKHSITRLTLRSLIRTAPRLLNPHV